MRISEGHEDQSLVAKADYFGCDARSARRCPLRIEMTDLAERQSQPLNFDAQPDDLDDLALEAQPRALRHELAMRAQIKHHRCPCLEPRSRP